MRMNQSEVDELFTDKSQKRATEGKAKRKELEEEDSK